MGMELYIMFNCDYTIVKQNTQRVYLHFDMWYFT